MGGVFLLEGIQKFIFPDALSVGRFAKIGIPSPDLTAPLVGVFEIGGGVLLVLGLVTRLAVIPLIVVIVVAIWTTKVPMFAHDGFWKMAHEARTDYAMRLGLRFLLIIGAGRWSCDAINL